MSEPIKGIKLIEHNMGGVRRDDDPSMPFVLELTCSVGDMFMGVAASFIYGREFVKVRGDTFEALKLFSDRNHFEEHPRLQSLVITNTVTGKVVFEKKK